MCSQLRLYVCVWGCVFGILNKQLSISVNRARGMPEAQVAQLQADTLGVRAEARALSSFIQTGLWERRR